MIGNKTVGGSVEMLKEKRQIGRGVERMIEKKTVREGLKKFIEKKLRIWTYGKVEKEENKYKL